LVSWEYGLQQLGCTTSRSAARVCCTKKLPRGVLHPEGINTNVRNAHMSWSCVPYPWSAARQEAEQEGHLSLMAGFRACILISPIDRGNKHFCYHSR